MSISKETQARITGQELHDKTESLQKEALEELENSKVSCSIYVRGRRFSDSFDRKNYLQRRQR